MVALGTIGKYVVIHKIGEGGTSKVYLAYDQETNKQVCIKILNPDMD